MLNVCNPRKICSAWPAGQSTTCSTWRREIKCGSTLLTNNERPQGIHFVCFSIFSWPSKEDENANACSNLEDASVHENVANDALKNNANAMHRLQGEGVPIENLKTGR